MSELPSQERCAAVRPAPLRAERFASRVEFTRLRDGARSWLLVTPAWTAALGLTPANFFGESYVSRTGRILALDTEQDGLQFMSRFEAEFGTDHDVLELRADMHAIADWVPLHPFACAA